MSEEKKVSELLGGWIPEPPQTKMCDRHRKYFSSTNLFRGIWSSCPLCVQELRESEQKTALEAQRQAEIDRFQKRIGFAGIPERFKDRQLEGYEAQSDEQKYILKVANAYVEKFDVVSSKGVCMVFCGKPGTGKTHIACGIALKLLQKNKSVLFTSVFKAIRRVKESWNRNSDETESQVIELFAKPDLLILDEVGVQFGSEAEKIILFDIINTRYEAQKPTIFISNLNADGVKSYVGERSWDRLKENGGKILTFNWESHRA